jgi:hypothetical protein
MRCVAHLGAAEGDDCEVGGGRPPEGYQACAVPQWGQPTDVVTSAFQL